MNELSTPPAASEAKITAGKLGTFNGVFTPSILTILGIILFLRLGYVVGNAGLGKALLIIALANLISVLTSISLSAVATNLKVKGGGDYYLISRTLGPEFGGSIGLVLFLAQSVSIAFYCMGFAEVIGTFFPWMHHLTIQLIASGAVVFLFFFAWQGADWAARFQFGVMALLAAALLSFFAGTIRSWDAAILAANWASPENGVPFWALFAIFFPAVTGFTQGVSMSGDLADPGKSIPLGTFWAVGLSIAVYFSVAILFAGVLSNATLSSDSGAMKNVSAVGFLIDAGVIAATLSSAMASLMGAPRILQSLAADKIFSLLTPFAKVNGPAANPRRALLFSSGIAFVTIALGKLNLVASVVSMFFLISYGLLNYATYFEAKTESPFFRPRFKWFSPSLSLLGFFLCLAAMLAIDLKSGAAAIALLFAVYQYLKRTAGPTRWADSSRSHHLQQVRRHLLAAGKEPEHARDWRPHLLVFTQTPEHRIPLLTFSSWIEGGSGFTEAVQIIEGEGAEARAMHKAAHLALTQAIASGHYDMFPLTVSSSNFTQAMGVLLQSSGIGPLRPNTVVLNWMGASVKALSGLGAYTYAKNLKLIFRQHKNLVILSMDDESWIRLLDEPMAGRRIDIWWQGNGTSRLMLLLAYLMTRHKPWDQATLRVLTQSDTLHIEREKEKLNKIMEDVRIDAVAEIIENFEADTIVQQSADAAFVFLPLKIDQYRLLDLTGKSFERSLPRLPVCALVMAAEDIDLDATPEEGLPAQIGRATDELELALKKSAAAEKIAAEKMMLVEKLSSQLSILEEKSVPEKVPPKEGEKLQREIANAESDAEKAHRRAIKAKFKADEAARNIDNLEPELQSKIEPPE
ncbi:amino acid transporter [Desulfocapsa sulfexigens DSM 10523]|uniref:Amino acid transporter n=1 Tax=Desulfocapsa sulfexigens (strain DSM 10523 / SB164P1) TaxID=1167006 RepID=M1NH33_DESSD|nr:amino acid permease [Desulfocapsa sulfexigens]AGF78924.1 amino acid transporter [Desulfocapsa sulfexigens DSM 10523]